MIDIELTRLITRPDNANRMPPELLRSLLGHIKRTGRYPALIVRPSPSLSNHFEILDGHHRAEALRSLGQTTARCEVWEVDDDEALVLLATLNRLEGHDDVDKRADLVSRLVEQFGKDRAVAMLPEDASHLQQLLDIRLEPPLPVEPPNLEAMPEAVTFFLTRPQRRRLLERLSDLAGTRTQQLVELLRLDESPAEPQEPDAPAGASGARTTDRC